MTKTLICLAAAGALALVPALASAQDSYRRCEQQKQGNALAGAVIGGIGGALLGNAIGRGGGREGGTVIGGLGGAAAGAAIGNSSVHCGENRYGWYDEGGQWVPRQRYASGWYGPDGAWVAADVAASAPTYGYETRTYETTPAYGAGGYENGVYDNGAYANGAYASRGAYDRRYALPSYAQPSYAQPSYAPQASRWDGDRHDTRAREAWLESQLNQDVADGRMDERSGRRALRQLAEIRDMDSAYRQYDGYLSGDQYRDIDERLDQLSQRTRASAY